MRLSILHGPFALAGPRRQLNCLGAYPFESVLRLTQRGSLFSQYPIHWIGWCIGSPGDCSPPPAARETATTRGVCRNGPIRNCRFARETRSPGAGACFRSRSDAVAKALVDLGTRG